MMTISQLAPKQNCQDTLAIGAQYTKQCKGVAGNFQRYGTFD